MALIFEDENKTLGKKQLKVPDEVVKKLKVTKIGRASCRERV